MRRSWSGLLLAMSNFGNFAFPLLRGIVLARLLSPHDFGLAMSITMILTIVGLISDVGLNQYAVRLGDGESVSTLHSVALIRGTLLALGIATCGPLIAAYMDAPDTSWVCGLAGITSFLRSFSHLGVKTAMRGYNFAPEAVADISSHVVWTIVSIGCALVLRDYRCMVFGLLSYSVTYVVATHLLATSRWRLGWDKGIVKEAARFGRLMVPNGIAIAAVNMGDRALIGSSLGLDALASYSVLSTSAFTPRSAIVRFLTALVTPQFVNASTALQADRLLVALMIVLAFIGSFFAFGYMAIGQSVIALVFGRQYSVGQGVVALIAVLSCIRYFAAVAAPPSLAKGDSALILLSTVTSVSGLALGFVAVLFHPKIDSMIAGMCGGELAALVYIVVKLLRSHPASSRRVWSILLPTVALVFGCATTIQVASFQTLLPKIEVCSGFLMAEVLTLIGNILAADLSIQSVLALFMPSRTEVASPDLRKA